MSIEPLDALEGRAFPCWANSLWHSNSSRALDEFEHVHVPWRPGITEHDRGRLEAGRVGIGGAGTSHPCAETAGTRPSSPRRLPNRAIRPLSPGVALDPFVGTGTTTAIAKRLGRRWPGIDLKASHARIAARRAVTPDELERHEETALSMLVPALTDHREQTQRSSARNNTFPKTSPRT